MVGDFDEGVHATSFFFRDGPHHGGRRMAECGPVASEIGGKMGLLAYMTQNGGLYACFPMVIVSFWCSGISSKEVTADLAILSAKSLARMFVSSLIFFSFVEMVCCVRWSL